MGIGVQVIADLLTLKKSGALDGCRRVIEIGSQQLANSALDAGDTLDELYERCSRPGVALGEPTVDFTTEAPPSRAFWESLGFEYAAVDFSGHRESLAVDLNSQSVPENMKGRFDLVINAGTTEHVANQDNAFRVIHDLAAANGVMYHEVPSGSWDHGLINYTPKFFFRLMQYNDYRKLILRERRPEDMTIRAALQKRSARAFVTPLDVPPELVPLRHRNPWRALRRISGIG